MKTLVLFSIFFFTLILSQGQWSYTDLAEAKFRIGVTSLGTKAYFAGGESNYGQVSAVEVYDVAIEYWDTVINLLMPRSHIACASSGTKIFFAGGVDFGTFAFFDIVDIWDTETRQWSYGQLSEPRFSISAVGHGDTVMFAGGANMGLGTNYDIVDVYNTETDEWSTTHLSMARSAMGAAVVGDLAFFAGGFDGLNVTDRVDIYNFTTNTWSTDALTQARAFLTATAVGTKVLFAGGTTADNESSDRVDIYDTETGEWSIAPLSQPRAFWEGNSGTVCDSKAYFVGGAIFDFNTNTYGYPYNTIDIYNLADDTWTADTTITPVLAHAVVGIDNHLLIAGGDTYNGLTSTLQIFRDDTCFHASVESRPAVGNQQSAVSIYPNPTHSTIEFRVSSIEFQLVSLKIYNAQGQEVAILLDQTLPAGKHTVQWDATALPAGIYYYRLTTDDCRLTTASGKLVVAK